MKKNFFKTFLVLGIIAVNLNANIISAKEANKISKIATKKVIENFMKNPQTKQAYKEVENYVSNTIKKVAKKGFYNIVHIQINDIYTKNMKFNKLSKQQKDILKYLLKKRLKTLGYKIEKGRYSNLGIDWWVTWK